VRRKEGKSKAGDEKKKSTDRDALELSKKRCRKSGKRKSSGEVLAME
jgi:hypothetical protein